jgi:hypothetical protein
VLLGKGTEVRLADAGLARFMHRNYMAAESSVGAFTWTVGPTLGRMVLIKPALRATRVWPPAFPAGGGRRALGRLLA